MAVTPALLSLLGACHLGYHVELHPRPLLDPVTPHPRLAKICLLRPQTFGALAAFQHYDNDRLVGVTQGAGVYFCYLAHAGLHNLVARSDNEARLQLWLHPRQVQYVQLKVAMGPDRIFRVDAPRARRLLPKLSYVVATPTASDIPAPCPHPIPPAPPPGVDPEAMPPPDTETCYPVL